MACIGECWDVGPPPDMILSMPPPPIPAFVLGALPELLFNTSLCGGPYRCDAYQAGGGHHQGGAGAARPNDDVYASNTGGEYIEMPRKDMENWSPTIGDTWLLVLVASAIGVLLLGALLAMFLLKCREMNMFGSNDCSLHNRQLKLNHHHHHETVARECAVSNGLNPASNKLVHPSETVLYHGNGTLHADNRMVWAALTPRGTQHFISESYPSDLVVDYIESADDHYETVDHLDAMRNAPATHHQYTPYYQQVLQHVQHAQQQQQAEARKGTTQPLLAKSFDNSGFVDYEYEEPTPLIESYQLNDLLERQRLQQQQAQQQQQHHYATLGNTDMRCASMRRMAPPTMQHYRPSVSSPTRIEHPNLPPLNLYPHNTLGKKQSMNGGGGYRNGDATMTLPKYGI